MGLTELLHGQAPWGVVVLFAVITQVGDVWFHFLIGSVLYVAGEYVPRVGIKRRRGLFVFALGVTYTGLIVVLKDVFMLPRPPGAGDPPALRWIPSVFAGLFTSITTADGTGFPSGHALGTTMVWGGLALVLDSGTYRTRAGVAGVVVVLVSISRLVLGVHYAVDVIVGVGLGVLVLGVLYWLADAGTDPERVLLVAVVIGGVAVLVHPSFDSLAAFGSAVGGWLVWRSVADSTPAYPSTNREVIAGFAVVGIVGSLYGVVYALDLPLLVTVVGAAITAGTVVGAPRIGERLI
ncbi:phosphatase PAP2 family protein [Halorussus sp. AFM4]|uniref:phosphatase PAP2 family protein n=1 Tax=Halorussus sp. AFM4 TaxID=3421651 RepID=UPI003EB70B83